MSWDDEEPCLNGLETLRRMERQVDPEGRSERAMLVLSAVSSVIIVAAVAALLAWK